MSTAGERFIWWVAKSALVIAALRYFAPAGGYAEAWISGIALSTLLLLLQAQDMRLSKVENYVDAAERKAAEILRPPE
jgi:hypothetical protein